MSTARLLLSFFCLLFCVAPFAQAKEEISPLTILTGPRTGTYIAFGKDIAALAKQKELQVEVLPSGGSIENIKRIANTDDTAALGVVQSDVLGFLGRSQTEDSHEISRRLRMVLPFYKEEVHLLVRTSITSVAELDGKRVVVGGAGSGSMLTSVNLFSILGIKPSKMYQVPPPEGIVAVLNNEADAILFVGGRPVRLFKNLEELAYITEGENAGKLDQVHFIPLDDARLKDEYAPATLTRQDYNYINEDVPTIAVTAVLVTRDFSDRNTPLEKARCEQLHTLVKIIRENFGFLKANSHPKWHEVDLNAGITGIWRRDSCAWPPVADDTGSPDDGNSAENAKPEKNALMGIVTRGRKE